MRRRHASAEEIARLAEEDLSTRRAARVRAHLAACPRCRAVRDQLDAVTAALAAAPAPPIPDYLSARITGALADEAAQRASAGAGRVTGQAPAPAPDRQAGRPAQDRTRSRSRLASPVALRVLAAAGAVVVVAGGGYEIAAHLGSSPGANQSASASVPHSASFSPRSAAAGPRAAAGSSVPRSPSRGPELRYGPNSQAASFTPVATGTDYRPGQLGAQVRQSIAESGPASAASPVPSGHASAPQQALGLPATALEGCVTRIASGGHVLLVDVAKYEGQRATVVATQTPGASSIRVDVVGPGCSAGGSDLIASQVIPAG